MVDLEIMAFADPTEDRAQDRLVDVVDPLAARADEVVVVFADAGHVRGYVPRSLEPRRHARFDLRLESAVDSRESQPGMAAVQAFVQLLR